MYNNPKLNENNYRKRAKQMKWILDEKELLELFEAIESKQKNPSHWASYGKTTPLSIIQCRNLFLIGSGGS